MSGEAGTPVSETRFGPILSSKMATPEGAVCPELGMIRAYPVRRLPLPSVTKDEAPLSPNENDCDADWPNPLNGIAMTSNNKTM